MEMRAIEFYFVRWREGLNAPFPSSIFDSSGGWILDSVFKLCSLNDPTQTQSLDTESNSFSHQQQIISKVTTETIFKMCDDKIEMSPQQFCEYMSERSIKDQEDRLFKFILRKAYKYAGRNGADPKPKKYRRYVHVAGAQAVKLRKDDDDDNKADGFAKIRKMYHQNKADYRDADTLLGKAQKDLDARREKMAGKEDDDDNVESSEGEEDCWFEMVMPVVPITRCYPGCRGKSGGLE